MEPRMVDLSICEAFELLVTGKAQKISCEDEGHGGYIHVDVHTGELRRKTHKGDFYPWVITQRDRDRKWRVVE